MTVAMPDIRLHAGARPPRVLVAVHGHETPGWAPETCRLVSTWGPSPVRLLRVLEVPSPPLTSLSRFARAAYEGARARWAELERRRVQPALETLRSGLPGEAELATVQVAHGDVARAIAEEARAWLAEAVVVGPPARGPRSWMTIGAVHERLVRLAPCTVVVIAAEPPATTSGSRRWLPMSQRAAAGQGA
jgi:nucleotide-binding universal stress UspA family protein